jgi:hypothetical protein
MQTHSCSSLRAAAVAQDTMPTMAALGLSPILAVLETARLLVPEGRVAWVAELHPLALMTAVEAQGF